MASLSEIVEHELGASPRSKLSITSESSLASVASLSMPLIQEIVLSADIRCSDCQEKIADIMSRMIGENCSLLLQIRPLLVLYLTQQSFLFSLFLPEAETYSILVSVLEKKVTLTCTYSGDRRVSKSYGEALLCKISILKRRIFPSSRKQQVNVT